MNVNRRGFLQIGGLIIGGIAITEAIPLNRVWWFPKEIVIAKSVPCIELAATQYLGSFGWLASHDLTIQAASGSAF